MATSGYGGTNPYSNIRGNVTPVSANTSQSPIAGSPTGTRRGGDAAYNAAKKFYGAGQGTGLPDATPSALGPGASFGNPSFDGSAGRGGPQKITGPWGTPKSPSGDGAGDGGPGTTGSESGPGILEQWFNQRVNGIDQGYEYAMDRGHRNINNEAAARGGYNSGAALQNLRDFDANMGAQREAQLDSLAGGASGEHQRRLEDMFGQGNAIAGGQAGLAGQYDIASGTGQAGINGAILQLLLNKGGVDSKNTQAVLQNLLAGLALL